RFFHDNRDERMSEKKDITREWWRGAVIYQIYPRSFMDTTGNGIGDLRGIINNMDYIADLGVDAVWLTPFLKSPMKDFGYDVSDFREVDPLFGTRAEFEELIAEAHARHIRIIMDIVVNHTSDQHPWFRESKRDRANPKADWYVWAPPRDDGTAPSNWRPTFGGPGWTFMPQREQYYYHGFLPEQPDLNFHCKAVQDAVYEELKFWLDEGIDGLRLDACNHFFQDTELRDNPPRPRNGRDISEP